MLVEEYQILRSALLACHHILQGSVIMSSLIANFALLRKFANLIEKFSGAKPGWLDDCGTECCKCLLKDGKSKHKNSSRLA